MTPDSELLRQFARTNSEAAFAELVKRHVNLVFSAALRQVNGDEHLAKDVAQMVFTDLARKAKSLSGRESLTGWLYTSAHFAAAKIIRGENRRRDREEKFMREPIHETAPEADWEKLRPTLDDAMHELKESDRDAILLRYFENRQFAEVGAKLGLNENAARMRVERALEKLRAVFAKRGITTATAFASVISANAIQIAPANLAATLTTASIATAGTGTFTLLKIMTATKLKLAFSAIVIASATTAFVAQHQTQNKLRAENEALQQQIAQLQTDNENFSNRLAETGDAKKLPDEQFMELLKLRGEVGVLRRQVDEFRKLQEERQQIQIAAQNQSNELAAAETEYKKHQEATRDAMINLRIIMQRYALVHDNKYATNFSQLSNEIANFRGSILEESIKTNAFEVINEGSMDIVTNANDSNINVIIAREKNPYQTPDGKWSRFYLFAGGAETEQISTNGNFDAFEQQHMISTSPNQ